MASVERNDPRTPSVQIADDLRAKVSGGQLPPGSRLPSGRELARRYQVALMTAQSALQRLREEGLVYSTGRGYFVAEEGERLNTTQGDHLTLSARLDAAEAQLKALQSRVEALEGPR